MIKLDTIKVWFCFVNESPALVPRSLKDSIFDFDRLHGFRILPAVNLLCLFWIKCCVAHNKKFTMKYGRLIGTDLIMFSSLDSDHIIIGLKSDGKLQYLNYPNITVTYPDVTTDYLGYNQKKLASKTESEYWDLYCNLGGDAYPDLSKYSDVKFISSNYGHILGIEYDGSLFSDFFTRDDPRMCIRDHVAENTPDGLDFIYVQTKFDNVIALQKNGTFYVWGECYREYPIFIPGRYSAVGINYAHIVGLVLEDHEDNHNDETKEEQKMRESDAKLTILSSKVSIEEYDMTLVEYQLIISQW